ncbi:MAG: hypothetical protein L3J93_02440 [Thermoplasmata archaeon]|nr:hypothetical protein [Thermoplasmata archaeon]
MDRSIAVAMALVAMLTAAAFVAPGPARSGVSGPLSPMPAAPPQDNISAYASGGYPVTSYDVGLSTGQVYFVATDTAADTSAVVAINDLNASRDHLLNPVATWTVLFHGGTTNSSLLTHAHYTIPVNLTYGGRWNITISATNGGFNSRLFTVQTFFATSSATPGVTLPAHTASLSVLVLKWANEQLYSAVTSVVVTGYYYTTTFVYTKIPGTPHPLGSVDLAWYNFSVPNDASGTIHLSVFANTTSGGGNTSATATSSLAVGRLGIPSVVLSTCPTGCVSSSFQSGTPVYTTIHALIAGGATGPATGVTATIKFEHGSTFVTPGGNPPATVVTDLTGSASITFLASEPAFATTGTNSVVVTVSDPADPSDTAQTGYGNFSIFNGTATPDVLVTWSSSEYFSGDTASAHWAIDGANASVTAGWGGDVWVAYLNGISGFSYHGALSPSATSGTITLAIPSNYVGSIILYVVISNATSARQVLSTAGVQAASLLLSPSETYYLPGDALTVQTSTQGAALSGTTLWATVVDNVGNWIVNGAVTGNTIPIHVPSSAAPTSYKVTVVALSSTLGTLANATVNLYEANGIDLVLGVTSSSNYIDGSYQPGQSVTVAYQFLARGTAVLPRTFTLVMSPSSSGYSSRGTVTVQTTGATGSFSYTVPNEVGNGVLIVYAQAQLGGPSCTSNCYTYGQFSVNVNKNPAALSYQLGGSGFTLGALALIIVILLGAVVLLLLWRRHSRPMLMKPDSGSGHGGTPPSPPP